MFRATDTLSAMTPAPAAKPEPKTLMALERRECRFPVSGSGAGTLFCAAPVDPWMPGFVGGSYCAHHRCATTADRLLWGQR